MSPTNEPGIIQVEIRRDVVRGGVVAALTITHIEPKRSTGAGWQRVTHGATFCFTNRAELESFQQQVKELMWPR